MPKKILVAEDEKAIVRLLELHLQRAGYEVVCAYDGREALSKAQQESPDLAIINIGMPYRDGWEVLRLIQANEAMRDLPVILTSTVPEAELEFRAMQCGAAYFQKPFDFEAIIGYIDRLLHVERARR